MPQDHVLILDLRDDPVLIEEYERHHRNVWPEVEQAIRASGVRDMRIYRAGIRLVMVMTVDDDFSFDRKAAMDRANPAVQHWERLMERFQNTVADVAKWRTAREIYRLMH